jgi:hypothetical protein
MLSINGGLSACLGAALNGLLEAGGTLTAGLTGGLAGLVTSGEALGDSLGAGLGGLAQTGGTLATIWTDTTAAVAKALAGGSESSVGVAFPGLFRTGEALAIGLEDAAARLAQTGGALTTSLEVALSDLGLSLRAALNASLGIGVAA